MGFYKCPICGTEYDEADGMCCNAGEDSGDQIFCTNCGVWFVRTFDGQYFIDEFLTAVVSPKEGWKKK